MSQQVSKFDECLTQLGTGIWNLIFFIGVGLWCLLMAPQSFSLVYLAPSLNYTCVTPDNVTSVAEDSCSYVKWSSGQSGQLVEEEEACTEWEYDTSTYSSTLTSEFDLVCSRAYLRATFQSIYTFASIFGSLALGAVADRLGRKPVVILSITSFTIATISIGIATNFTTILVMRTLMGALAAPTFYMLALEVCQVKHRSLVGILVALPWAGGMMMWGGLAYLIRDWRWLQLTVSIPTLILCVFAFLIDESPRWLIVQGKHRQAMKVLQRAERLNKVTLPPVQDLYVMMAATQAESQNYGAKTEKIKTEQDNGSCCKLRMPKLLSTHKIRVVMGVLLVNMFVSSLVYCGLSLSGDVYNVDPFLYVVLSGLMEVPGYTVTAPIIARWGRKVPCIIGYFICGATILTLAFISTDISWLVVTLVMTGKLAISGSFMIIFVYQGELLPTEVRLLGVGISMVAAQIASSFAPFVANYLSPLVPWLPSVLFGGSSFVAGMVLLLLPETLGAPMPDTIHDLERLWDRKRRYDNEKDDGQLETLTVQERM